MREDFPTSTLSVSSLASFALVALLAAAVVLSSSAPAAEALLFRGGITEGFDARAGFHRSSLDISGIWGLVYLRRCGS
jgi:hypothetical protein